MLLWSICVAITDSEEANGPSSGFIFLCSKHKPLAKVNTCVLKSAPGLGVIGTRASFTESSSSVREAYIETQRCRYFEGTRHPQIASPSASLWLPFFLHLRMLSEFDSCSIFPVAQSQGLSQMHYFHWGQLCSRASVVISGCWEVIFCCWEKSHKFPRLIVFLFYCLLWILHHFWF